MGVSFDDYMKWKTPTNRTGFLDNLGRYGSHTTYNGGVSKASAQAHKELIGLAKKSKSISAYQKAVRNWANDRLPFGIFDLPF